MAKYPERAWKLSSAEQKFVEDNMKLIPAISESLKSFINIDIDEAESAAYLALCLATHSWFKEDRSKSKHSFRAFLHKAVKDTLFNEKHRNNLINTPEDLVNKIEKRRDAYYKKTGWKLSNTELAKELGISELDIIDFDRASPPEGFISLDEEMCVDGEDD